eukprot:887970-Rhodomonas_salina.1
MGQAPALHAACLQLQLEALDFIPSCILDVVLDVDVVQLHFRVSRRGWRVRVRVNPLHGFLE